MEHNQSYLEVVSLLATLQQQLALCEQIEQSQNIAYEDALREIEDHFDLCRAALLARKHTLLNDLDTLQDSAQVYSLTFYFNGVLRLYLAGISSECCSSNHFVSCY